MTNIITKKNGFGKEFDVIITENISDYYSCLTMEWMMPPEAKAVSSPCSTSHADLLTFTLFSG